QNQNQVALAAWSLQRPRSFNCSIERLLSRRWNSQPARFTTRRAPVPQFLRCGVVLETFFRLGLIFANWGRRRGRDVVLHRHRKRRRAQVRRRHWPRKLRTARRYIHEREPILLLGDDL